MGRQLDAPPLPYFIPTHPRFPFKGTHQSHWQRPESHRRKILHFNVTPNAHALWIVQQLREAWAYQQPHRFLLCDREAKFGVDVVSAVREIGSKPTRRALAVRGRTLQSAGWEVVDATCPTM